MEQITYNKNSGAMSYANAPAVAVGSIIQLSSLRAPEGTQIMGLVFGAAFSNSAAWVGGSFNLFVNGKVVFSVLDEIGDLLRPASLPIEIHGKDLVEVIFYNRSSVVVDVASMLKVVFV